MSFTCSSYQRIESSWIRPYVNNISHLLFSAVSNMVLQRHNLKACSTCLWLSIQLLCWPRNLRDEPCSVYSAVLGHSATTGRPQQIPAVLATSPRAVQQQGC